jgi:hypothetical protein
MHAVCSDVAVERQLRRCNDHSCLTTCITHTQVGQRVAASTKSFTAQITKSFTEAGAGALIAKSFSRALSGDIISTRAQGGIAAGAGSVSPAIARQSLSPC